MLLRLGTDDAGELRRALVEAHRDVVRDLSKLVGCGYSPRGLELCRKRSSLERLLKHLDGASEVPSIPDAAPERVRLSVAA